MTTQNIRLKSVIFSYECVWLGKKLIPTEDLDAGIGDNAVDQLTVDCDIDGTYSHGLTNCACICLKPFESSSPYITDIEAYACTRPCPLPSLPEPEIMDHDWSDLEVKPEIEDVVR